MDEENNATDLSPLDYQGELTLEALSVLNTYQNSLCNKSLTARKLHKDYTQVRKFLKQPYVRELFKLALLKAGVTFDKLAEGVAKGLDANDGIYWGGKKVDERPNWFARAKFHEIAAESWEIVKYNTKVDVQQNNFIVNNEEKNIRQRITVILESMKKEQKGEAV